LLSSVCKRLLLGEIFFWMFQANQSDMDICWTEAGRLQTRTSFEYLSGAKPLQLFNHTLANLSSP